ncbi:hypothetical protein JR316_0007859 [Psilocybe cubensis]|uniref:Uncharacterized protein n=1 Tax=Psilocybe cubensis TaxID=181762 RepID=A0ACB8GUF1_PSICU|nr:hypothetical protein JR316_0007859 [Psilocybe cubensis]KAH9479271.1 hypothetical protein JR316_0007859 [Psilocybe cubensis]
MQSGEPGPEVGFHAFRLAVFAIPPARSVSVALQAAFRDPSSPFHIPPGSTGPESPDSPPTQARLTTLASSESKSDYPDLLTEGYEKLRRGGFDPESFWEQRIVWGDHDSFQHVNNVRYVRFFESARIQWLMSLGKEIGGPEKAKAMINGQGISLILKSIEVKFRRPVTYPDSLLIGYRPLSLSSGEDPSTFHVTASAYSVAQGAYVAHSKEALVWYDYDILKKCDPGERAINVLRGRMTKN